MDSAQQAARQTARKRLASSGEHEAAEELARRGYVIVARNYHCRGGEADLVAEDGDVLVFVEVKTRSQLRHGLPREAVGWTKQQRLGRAAEHYCAAQGIEDRPIRFDIVEVIVLRNQVVAIEVIANAFIPEM
jgi:putative endonuclease